jgi:hypothetical protein
MGGFGFSGLTVRIWFMPLQLMVHLGQIKQQLGLAPMGATFQFGLMEHTFTMLMPITRKFLIDVEHPSAMEA